ncbi:hypothetical protein F53441_9843 [Fusarium austroafricanum]|uniref:Uncharacterized protein n=1 Tax=Fusarium austroafricanum TaxID=2364996 RepID=A0A8H4KBZ8_9HYPO|nr:hypothetical protein F53441_9843 [Fusarium austroafricanum]
MDRRIADDEQECDRQAYAYTPVYPQQSFQEPSVSLQSPLSQSPPVRTVSPPQISYRGLSRDEMLSLEPQVPASQETLQETKRSLMSDGPANDACSKNSTMKGKWSMIACATIGIAGAISHNFLYMHLDVHEATNQQWWLRLGQLISFISNANFILATVMAHQQIAWKAIGQRAFSIQAIDSLFGAAHNILELFNREAWIKSKFAMFLVLYMWFSPLIVILTSATLFVVPGIEHTLCPNVRSLNFSNEAKESFRAPKKAKGEIMNGRSLSGYNWTAKDGNLTKGAKDNNDIFEYFNVPSPSLDRIADGVFPNPSSRAAQRNNVSEDIRGEGKDCTFTIEFLGPGYKCMEFANGSAPGMMKKFGDAKAPFNLSYLVPAGNYTYIADTDLGEYVQPQMDNMTLGGIPSDGPPYPKNFGVFRTEPIHSGRRTGCDGGAASNYPCERRRKENFFDYNWPVLTAVYIMASIITSIGVYYGIDAMSSDGIHTQRVTNFSAIALATDKISIDEIEKKETVIRYVLM